MGERGERFLRERRSKPRESTRVMRAVINILSVVEKRSGEREEDADRKRERPDEEKRSFSLNLSLFPSTLSPPAHSVSRLPLPFDRSPSRRIPSASAKIKRAIERLPAATGRPPPPPIGSKLNS